MTPPNSLVLLVGREEFSVPGSFGGTVCAATIDCIAVGVRSSADGSSLVSLAPTAPGSALSTLGEFTIESEGLISLRDVYFREHDAMGVEPGLVHVTVLGNDVAGPDEVLFVVQPA